MLSCETVVGEVPGRLFGYSAEESACREQRAPNIVFIIASKNLGEFRYNAARRPLLKKAAIVPDVESPSRYRARMPFHHSKQQALHVHIAAAIGCP